LASQEADAVHGQFPWCAAASAGGLPGETADHLKDRGHVQQHVQQPERLSPSEYTAIRPPTSGNDHH
jgi:hypothetical protein